MPCLECPDPVLARGLCGKHYRKAHRAGTLDVVANPPQHAPDEQHKLAGLDTDALTATCIICGPTRVKHRKGRGKYVCVGGSSYGAGRQERPYVYGDGQRVPNAVAREAYAIMMEDQQGLCAICKRPPRAGTGLVLDHCHDSGKLRGLLCSSCNLAIGLLQDDPDQLDAAAQYLRA